MRDLKLTHYFFFVLIFLMLNYAQIPLGSLLVIFLWHQMAIYLWKQPLTKKTQIASLVHSLSLVPIFFFLGAVTSFLFIYMKAINIKITLLALTLNFIISFMLILFGLSFFKDYSENRKLYPLYINAINKLKIRKFYFLKLNLAFTVMLLALQFLTVEYALVASYILVHIMGTKILQMPEISDELAQ